jgi:hypothetical protein
VQRAGHPGGAGRPRAAAPPAGVEPLWLLLLGHSFTAHISRRLQCCWWCSLRWQPTAHPHYVLSSLQAILETLAQATLAYGRRNVRMLYDALSTLAEAVGRGEQPTHLSGHGGQPGILVPLIFN